MAWHSTLTLGFTPQAGKTLLSTREHQGALRVQRALYPETNNNTGICHVILLYPPAGIAGGDMLNIILNAHANTHTVLTTPEANKWYGMPPIKADKNTTKKSQQPTGKQQLTAQLSNHARLEWLPQETIFYDDSHATAINHIYLADTASFIGWEINVLGRQAYQEIYKKGTLSLQTYFWRDEKGHPESAKLIFADVLNQQLLEKNNTTSPHSSNWFSSATGLNYQPIFATLWAVPTVEQKVHLKSWVEKLACTIKDYQLPIVVTHTSKVLLIRYLGDDVQACFSAFSQIRGELRRLMWDLDNHEPRIWAT